jgi:chromosome partitioning protein
VVAARRRASSQLREHLSNWVDRGAGRPRERFRVSTALFRICREAGAGVGADVVFIDLGPNVNALNRTALIAADAFVVPLAPDLFSVMALPNVGQSIAGWVREWQTAKTVIDTKGGVSFALPDGRPKPLGYLSQQFSVYRKQPAAAFKNWLDKVPGAYAAGVCQPLAGVGIASPPGDQELDKIPNYFGLIPLAQEARKAMFELTGAEARGAQYTKATETRATFEGIGQAILERVGAP